MLETSKQAMALVVCIVVVLAVGNIGTMTTIKATHSWYAQIQKPAWTPPDWVFGPVWTALFVMMAVAAWLVWRQGGFAAQKLPLMLFLVQLALNAAWTPLFFGAGWFGAALLEILLLWCAILATMIVFRQTNPAAGWLMLPYFLWVSYASTLNAGIWWLHRK